jgi:hypothetical protein
MSDIVGRQYIKKVPLKIEAIQLNKDNIFFLTNWCGGKIIVLPSIMTNIDLTIAIDLPHTRVFMGNYITRDSEGFFDCISDTAFECEYQPS